MQNKVYFSKFPKRKSSGLMGGALIFAAFVYLSGAFSLIGLLQYTYRPNYDYFNSGSSAGEAAANTDCFDSDNGLNYFVKGYAKGSNGEFSDRCASDTSLVEYYCEVKKYYGGDTSPGYLGNANRALEKLTGTVSSNQFPCSGGVCIDGACLQNK